MKIKLAVFFWLQLGVIVLHSCGVGDENINKLKKSYKKAPMHIASKPRNTIKQLLVSLNREVYIMIDDSENTLGMSFGLNSCDINFPIIELGDGHVQLYWDTSRLNCDYVPEFYSDENIKFCPKAGQMFGEMNALSDTSVVLKYINLEFVNRMNQVARNRANGYEFDTLFPKVFVIANR